MFSITNIITGVASIANLLLAVIVVRRNWRRPLNFYFFLFSILTSIWVFTNLLFSLSHNLLTIKSQYATGAAILPLAFIWFSFLLLKKPRYGFVSLMIATSLLLLILPYINGLVIKGFVLDNNKVVLTFGPLFNYFSYISLAIFTFLLIRLIIGLRRNSGLIRSQIKFVLLGASLFGGISMIYSFVLPFFNFRSVAPIDAQSSLFFVGFSAYAILKHRLLDIRFIVLRTITYSLVVLLISATIVGLAIFLPETLNVTAITKTVIAIITSLFIILIIDPLRKFIGKITDFIFFKAKVDYQKLLSELSEIINREIDLDVLLFSMSRKMEKELKVKNVSIYLGTGVGGAFIKRTGRVDKSGKKIVEEKSVTEVKLEEEELINRLTHNNPLISYLQGEHEIIVLEALERKIEDTQVEADRKKLEESKSSLDQMDASVIAPIVVGNNLNAVMVLGPKLSGDPYGTEDLELLKLIGPQLASALDKSRLYEEAQQFTERLKKEVALATESLRGANSQLQERNQFLSALQNMTTLMTRTLDFKKVTQSLADSINTELGYIGGIVLFLGKDRHKLFADAVTNSHKTAEVIKLLPKPITEYWGDYRRNKSRTITAITEGKEQIGTDFTDFLSPAVPPEIVKKMQEVLKIKCVVAMPIHAEGDVVGAILYILAQPPQELKETDLAIMKALANQSGIVYRNIRLFEQLKVTNSDLEEANKHLQELDQAKSEFVSIASHQLRTPMTGIMGYLSMVLDGDFGKVPAEQEKVLTGLLTESQRMIRLINLFLDVTKIESGKLQLTLQPMNVVESIDRVIELLSKPAEDKKLKLIFNKPAGVIPEIMADHDKFSDIVANLVDNAIKYSEQGSITVSLIPMKTLMKISVQDTGRGIDHEEAKKLFTKFVRGYGIAQVNPDGSGLRLYVARRLTEAHHGRIWVESEGLGKGSTFFVEIPLAKK